MTNEQKKQAKLEKRIARVAGKAPTEFSVMTSYRVLLTHPHTCRTSMRFFISVIRNYFFRQFFNKWHITHVPVIHVDHPLDKRVPFLPEKVGIYFRFIDFWIEPMSMMIKRYGAWKGTLFCKEWLKAITKVYQSGGQVYTGYLSTTDRPHYTGDKNFRLIHRADPHLLCVPSLHIAIIVLCFTFYRMLFEREGFTEAEKALWNDSLYKEAVAIAESVLYIKQHSVNCIPAAFYMMTMQFPELVQPATIERFIDDMFATAPESEIKAVDAADIRAYMRERYHLFMEQGKTAAHWYEPVHTWLATYVTPESYSTSAAQTQARRQTNLRDSGRGLSAFQTRRP